MKIKLSLKKKNIGNSEKCELMRLIEVETLRLIEVKTK